MTLAEDVFLVSGNLFVPGRVFFDALLTAIFFPDLVVRQVADLFLKHELLRVIVGVLRFLEEVPRGAEGFKDGLVHVARADDDRGDAVEGPVEIIEADVGLLQGVVAHELVSDFLQVVVELEDVVAVPTDRARDVEGAARGT